MLNMRRRGLMGRNEMNHLLYALYDQAVAAGDFINTAVKPFQADMDCTILFDITIAANPTSGYGRQWHLMRVYNTEQSYTEFSVGKSSGTAQAQNAKWCSNSGEAIGTTTAARYRYAVTHEANSDTITLKYKKDSKAITTKTYTSTFSPAATNPLTFGISQNTDFSLPAGTINKAEVYDIVLDSTSINLFFA